MNSSDSPTPGVTPLEEAIDVDKMVGQYVALRDRKRSMEKQHKDALAPYTEVLDRIAGKLLAHMEKTGVSSLSTKHGSAYQSTKPSATISDGEAFKGWVKKTQSFDLVDWKANAKAVLGYIKVNNGAPPPGVNFSTFTTVGVRRPNETAED